MHLNVSSEEQKQVEDIASPADLGIVYEDIQLQTIVFGSCCNQSQGQGIWPAIIAEEPDLFIMCGDNVYADTYDMDNMRASYQQLFDVPQFQELTDMCPVLAIYDDHDYGVNDGGKEYSMRAEIGRHL